MALIDLLDPPIAYHRVFRAITGSTVAAVLLSQAHYWQQICDKKKCGDGLGWWWKDREEWEDETGLSRSEQETARKRLVQLGILKEKRRGIPARMWYHLDTDVLEEKLQQYQQIAGNKPTRKRNPRQPAGEKPAALKAENQPSIPKTFSEITTENTHTLAEGKTTNSSESEIDQYLALVVAPAALRKRNPERYRRRVRERLTKQQGLCERDRRQLNAVLREKHLTPVADSNDKAQLCEYYLAQEQAPAPKPQAYIYPTENAPLRGGFIDLFPPNRDPTGTLDADREIRRTKELIRQYGG